MIKNIYGHPAVYPIIEPPKVIKEKVRKVEPVVKSKGVDIKA